MHLSLGMEVSCEAASPNTRIRIQPTARVMQESAANGHLHTTDPWKNSTPLKHLLDVVGSERARASVRRLCGVGAHSPVL